MKIKLFGLLVSPLRAISVIVATVVFNSAAASTTYLFTSPGDVFILEPRGYRLCSLGEGICDQEWTTWSVSNIEPDQIVSFNMDSSNFAYYLGDTLNSEFIVTLSPNFRHENTYPSPQDELAAWIADRESVILKTDHGESLFSASLGTDYYLLLVGRIRSGQEYQLQISHVPLPEASLLLLSGLGFFAAMAKSRKG